MKHLLLLGGGHVHVHLLHAFAQEALPNVRVTLVSPFPRQMYSGMVPGLVAGHYRVSDCVIPLAPLAQRVRAEFIESSAVRLDAGAQRVTLASAQVISYDVLSVDTGQVMNRDAIPGARKHGMFVRPIEHFARTWEMLLASADQGGLSVAVIGAGAAGVELALAIQYRLADRARVSLVTGGPAPLAEYPMPVRELARNALRHQGITVIEDTCVQISAQHVHLGGGARLQCDAPVLAIGGSAPAWLVGSGLALDQHGFIATALTLQSTSHPQVFAAGDVASSVALQRPKSGVFAVRAGPPLALNLRRYLGPGGALQEHLPELRALNLLACGRRSAIVSWGSWSAQSALAWYWKDWIDRKFVAKYR